MIKERLIQVNVYVLAIILKIIHKFVDYAMTIGFLHNLKKFI